MENRKNFVRGRLSRITNFCMAIFMLMIIYGCPERVIVKETIREVPAAPTVVAAAAPTPSGSSSEIFFDEFDPNNSAIRNVWKSNGKAHWVWQGKTDPSLDGCENGCLKQNSEDTRALNAIMYVSTPQISNATIKVKTRLKYDQSVAPTPEELKNLRYFIGTGIIFRMVDENNYYMFRLAGEAGCVLGKMVNNEWIDLANPRRLDFLEGGRVRPNNWYRLKVKVYGNNIQCFINDSPVINISDTQFTIGNFGLCTFKSFADFEFIEISEY